MKMIVAVVHDYMAQRVVDALHSLPGVSGATLTEVRGFGRGRVRGGEGTEEEELLGTAARTRVEIVVRDGHMDAVVAAVSRAAHTGNRGDGKVFVLPVDQTVRISTGERGDGAL